jgi:hypothetical protein
MKGTTMRPLRNPDFWRGSEGGPLPKHRNVPGPLAALWALFAALVLSSCAGIEKEAVERPVSRSFEYSEIKSLSSQGGLRMAFKFTLLDFEGPPALKEAVRAALYAGEEPVRYAEKTTAAFAAQVKGGLDGHETFTQETSVEWEYFEKFSVKSQSPGYLSLCCERYYYTGGAHGNGEEKFFVLDRADGRLLSLDDIAAGNASPALTRLVNEALRQRFNLAPSASLTEAGFFEAEAPVPEGFYLRPGALVFHWKSYEIAPYAMGPVEVEIPREKLAGLLTPRGEAILAGD